MPHSRPLCRRAASPKPAGRPSPRRSHHSTNRRSCVSAATLVEGLKRGLDAPICLTLEMTYACSLQCVHWLSSSGRREPGELTAAQAKQVLDELRDLQVFYINIG